MGAREGIGVVGSKVGTADGAKQSPEEAAPGLDQVPEGHESVQSAVIPVNVPYFPALHAVHE